MVAFVKKIRRAHDDIRPVFFNQKLNIIKRMDGFFFTAPASSALGGNSGRCTEIIRNNFRGNFGERERVGGGTRLRMLHKATSCG